VATGDTQLHSRDVDEFVDNDLSSMLENLFHLEENTQTQILPELLPQIHLNPTDTQLNQCSWCKKIFELEKHFPLHVARCPVRFFVDDRNLQIRIPVVNKNNHSTCKLQISESDQQIDASPLVPQSDQQIAVCPSPVTNIGDTTSSLRYNTAEKLLKNCNWCNQYFEAKHGLSVHQAKCPNRPNRTTQLACGRRDGGGGGVVADSSENNINI
jgi:hypothetical protein